MNTTHPVDTLQLTSWFCGEGTTEERARIADHVLSCVTCRRRIEELKAEKEAFLKAMPFDESMAQGVRHSRRDWLRPLYAAAAVLVVAVGVSVMYAPGSTESGFRTKGAAGAVALFVRNAEGEPETRADNVYYPGERVQMTYSSETPAWFVLLGIDEKGTITTYFPAQGDTAMPLSAGRDLPLPNSIQLDEYVGEEWYVAAFSSKAFAVETLRESLRTQFETAGGLATLDVTGNGATVQVLRTTKKVRSP